MRRKTTPFWEPDATLRRADEAAESVSTWCLKALGLGESPLCVPVDVWIERPLDMQLEVTDLSHLGEGTEGSADTRQFIIQIEQSIASDDSRFRFACAHELGHIVLHRNAKKVFHEYTHIGRIYLDLYERQADRFAMAFLIPIPSIFARLFDLANQHNADRVRFMDVLMAETTQSERIWDQLVLSDLQTVFGLARWILVTRLSSLRMRGNGRLFMPPAIARALCPELMLDGVGPAIPKFQPSSSSAVHGSA